MGTPNDIAKAFLDAYAAKYAAADANGLGSLYGEDSVVSFDGQSVKGRAAIVAAMGPRMAGGPVGLRWTSYDAQGTPSGALLVFVTGDSTAPAGKFAAGFTLLPIAGGGMYVRNEVTRFGPGGAPQNASLDASGLGASFAQQYFSVFSSNRASLAGVYRDSSQLTFEGRPATGGAAVMAEVARLPTGTQEVASLDVQPLTADSVLVVVTGKIVIEGEANALATAQAFLVVNQPGAGPFVSNQVFRFNYG